MQESIKPITLPGDRILFRLPKRELDDLRRWGWWPIGSGAFGIVFMLFWIGTPFSWGIGLLMQNQAFGWALIAFGLLGWSGLFFSLKLFAFGLSVLRNTTWSEIELRPKILIDRQRFGWFTFKTKWKVADIQRFELSTDMNSGSGVKNTTGNNWFVDKMPEDCCALRVVMKQRAQGREHLAIAYPKEIVVEIGQALAESLEAIRSEASGSGLSSTFRDSPLVADSSPLVADRVDAPTSSSLLFDATASPADSGIPVRPIDTKIEFRRTEDKTLVCNIPPSGFINTTRFSLFFSLAWIAFTTLFSTLLILGEMQNPQPGFGFLLSCGMMLLFEIIGVSLLVHSFSLARRSTMIGVDEYLLFYEIKGLFKTRWVEFNRADIRTVDMGPSNSSVNDVPIPELQISLKIGKKRKVGLLSQLPESDLQWLAYQLRQELQLEKFALLSEASKIESDEVLHIPSQCDVIYHDIADVRTITIPIRPWEWFDRYTVLTYILYGFATGALIWLFAFDGGIICIGLAILLCFLGIANLVHRWLVINTLYKIECRCDSLQITRSRPGSVESIKFWTSDKLKSVELNIYMTNEQTPYYQLLIRSRFAPPYKLMKDYPPDDINYVASLIYQKVGIEKSPR